MKFAISKRDGVFITKRLFQPAVEKMENRDLMTVDLKNITTQPYGIQVQDTTTGLGESVAVVGDVNGDKLQDYAVSNPRSNYVELIFGSKNFLTFSSAQRAADINKIYPGASISGLRFTDERLQGNSRFGTSVAAAGDVNGDGYADFLIGSPNAKNQSGAQDDTGRAYLIYGSKSLSNLGRSLVDMADASTDGVAATAFVNTLGGSLTGTSVAFAGNVFGSGISVSIGAPAANKYGAVYVVANNVLINNIGKTVDLTKIAAGSGLNGLVLSGSSGFSGTGESVSFTDFDNDGLTDIIVGSPYNLTPSATLVYGSPNLLNKTINLSTVGTTQTPGIIFTGDTYDWTGFSVILHAAINDTFSKV